MRTPAGNECPYFYGDYYRGKNFEECRLLGTRPAPNNWKADLCKSCPVPGIKRANACPTLELTAAIKKGPMGKKRQVKVIAFCTRSQADVQVPEVGCGICHPVSEIFTIKPE